MTVAQGTVLKDNIELVSELGRGAMGVVWLAKNRALDSEVCVKVLKSGAEEPGLRERFLLEAKAVARIDHPHVVRIFDYGVTPEGAPFFVMERLRGRDLYARIGEEGPLPLDEVVQVLEQAASALARAHGLGVVHRDIKPANVFLVEGAGRVFVKLLDFGIAKVTTADDLGLTQTASLLGTPYYMSPEQFIDPRRVDHRTDLWSLTVVAYACVAGQLPFLGASVGALSLAVHRGDFVRPTEVAPHLPVALDAWFTRALDPDPELRFQTAAELAEAFAQAARGEAPASAPHESTASSADEVASLDTVPAEAGDVALAATLAPDSDAAPSPREPSVALARTASPALEASASVEPVTSTRSAAQPSPPDRRRLALFAAAAIATAIVVGWRLSSDDGDAPPQSMAETAPPAEAPREVTVRVDPPEAEVRVNGVARPNHAGLIRLRGDAGESFLVEVREGERSLERTIFITRDGAPSIDRLSLPPAVAAAPEEAASGPVAPAPVPLPARPPRPAAPATQSPPVSSPPAPSSVPPSREEW